MASRRKEIRTAIASALSAITAVGGRVYPSRVYPVDTLPAIGVYTPSDAVEEDSRTMGGGFNRAYTCAIEVMVKQTAEFDDTFDDIADEVEGIILALSFTGMCVQYTSTDIEYSGESEQPTAVGIITFTLY